MSQFRIAQLDEFSELMIGFMVDISIVYQIYIYIYIYVNINIIYIRISNGDIFIFIYYDLVMTHIAMERSTMLLIGKLSISMGHLYHGYVSHNQRVYL